MLFRSLQAEFNEASLLRTTQNIALGLTGIVDDRRGEISLNQTDRAEIDQAIDSLWKSTNAAVPDSANDIAPASSHQAFSSGPLAPELESMYDRLDELLEYRATEHPSVTFGSASVVHIASRTSFAIDPAC